MGLAKKDIVFITQKKQTDFGQSAFHNFFQEDQTQHNSHTIVDGIDGDIPGILYYRWWRLK